ncbi:MAG: ATP-binding protein [Rhodospirillales bacterium]|nr:ATP-binding protein [Alphaproteobacteria bacterium]MCB9976763.1 ATP-binding protein [Rhodospirillales bacterium]
MSAEEEIKSIPDPARTMEGLRDTGYEFETAIADIVDNSIAANASEVNIQITQDFRGAIRILVTDDGDGMNREELIAAMQYGSPERPNPASLGKYGLGLKTASTAYCRRLSVISRKSGDEKPVMATWDLDHVMHKAKDWVLLVSEEPDEEAVKHLNILAKDTSGTVVLWSKVDRLLGNYQDPVGGFAKRALDKRRNELREHLGTIYQRFLDHKDKRAPNVVIKIDGKKIEPWDPFQTAVSELVANEAQKVEWEGQEAEFTVKAYILPRREEFPSDELAKEAKLSSERQGIYIYRENRLIHDADWLDMYQKEPHGTLLRVEFSFDHRLDDAFHLDIKKSQIILNDDLWLYLKDQFLPAPRRQANLRYREGKKKDITKAAKGAHDASNRNIKNKEAEVGGAEVNIRDPNTGEVTITNKNGTFNMKLSISSANKPGEVYVQPVDELNDGMLFEPALIEQHKAVKINTSHPYYQKVYVPNFNKSVTMQGMDSLMWGLAIAELNATSDKVQQDFENMRYEVSRVLRTLVDNLPEPETDSEADVA